MSFKFNPFTGNLDISGTDGGGPQYVLKSGDTMAGKLIVAANDTASKLNIGNALVGTSPTTTVNGDVWITNGNRLAYRSNSTVYNTAQTNLQNTFNQPQAVDASSATTALRVTQRGAGEALRVEDETTPDATAFVVSNAGKVGIGVTPDATVALSVDSTGVKFGDGTIQTTAASGGVTSISAGTTGLTPATATTGAVTLAGTLAVANGGTGSTTAPNALTALGAVAKAGDTMTGKLNLPASTLSSVPLNLGNGVSPTTTVAGDVFSSGNNIFFKGTTGGPYIFAYKNDTNTFLVPQIISTVSPTGDSAPALRITQAGGGEALRVEDQTTPDSTAFVVSTSGRVGVGVTPDATVALSVDATGVKFNDGTIQTTAAITTTAIRGQVSKMTSGTITIATAGTYQSTGLTATLDATTAVGMTLGTTDLFAVKNTSAATRVLKIYSSMDASSANNEILGIRMAKNGTSIPETECRNNTGSHNFAKLITNWMITMAPNDEVALFVANHSSTNSISLQRARVTASFAD
jgi:hypothetical protein